MASKPLKLIVTTVTHDFDPVTLQHFRDEGYSVTYLPFRGTRSEYIKALNGLADPLESGDSYAIVAYGAAASIVLEVCQNPMPKLSALVCYYPIILPAPSASFPSKVRLVIHIAGSQGIGAPSFKSYLYPDAEPGFAGVDFECFDKVAAGLAWSRTLGCLRQALGVEVDLEAIWEEHTACGFVNFRSFKLSLMCLLFDQVEFGIKDVVATMATMVSEPYVNHIPTCTGGIGYKDLFRFYRDYFIPGNPPSLKMRLISRTVGTDRVVDELYMSFRHTQVMPWILPGIEPTDREVEVALVAIVCIRGGKLCHEHIHWDQASVLVQIGLLDPNLIPGRGIGKLPVVNAIGARKLVDEKAVKSNELISDW